MNAVVVYSFMKITPFFTHLFAKTSLSRSPFFNYNSLSELDEGHYFSWPRNAPCVDYWKYWGALAVALIISLFWLVGDVHLRRNEGDERR